MTATTQRKPSQKSLVLLHLRKHGSLSSVEAEAVYKIRRLASRIDELRQEGHEIVSVPREDALGQRYVRYKLARKIRQRMPRASLADLAGASAVAG